MITSAILTGPQDAAFAQCRRIKDTVYSTNGVQDLDDLITSGNFRGQPWLDEVEAELAQVNEGLFVRRDAESGQSNESQDLHADKAEGEHLLLDIQMSLEQAAADEARAQRGKPAHEVTREAADLLGRIHPPEDSQRDVERSVLFAWKVLSEAGDLKRFGLQADTLDRCKSVMGATDADMRAMTNAQTGISKGADMVQESLEILAERMEEVLRARNLASHRLRRELTTYDLRDIRAAVARPKSTPDAANTATAPAPANGL